MNRLEELMQWQRQQQEKLLLHQQEQKELLNQEQKRLYQVFGLGHLEVNHTNEVSKINMIEQSFDDCTRYASHNTSAGDTLTSSSVIRPSDLREQSNNTRVTFKAGPSNVSHMADSTQSHSPDNEVHRNGTNSITNTSLDDVPIQTSTKDFYQLLQRKLELDGQNAHENSATNVQDKPKRKFLKKGEGLARFHMRTNEAKPKAKVRNSKSATSSHSKHVVRPGPLKLVKSSSNNQVESRKKDANQAKIAPPPSVVKSGKVKQTRAGTKLTLRTPEQQASTSPSMPTWAHVFKSLTPNAILNASGDTSVDFERKTRKELEELKIFELLEQHAANSSFCSTSSLVARLMEDSIKSTPIKNAASKPATNFLRNQNALGQHEVNFPVGNMHVLDNQSESELSGCEPFQDTAMQLGNGSQLSCNPFQNAWQHSQNIRENVSETHRTTVNVCGDQWETEKVSETCVSFAPDSDYKSDSESDTTCIPMRSPADCVNSAEPEGRNSVCIEESRDDQAWSDVCSCSSCANSESDSYIVSPDDNKRKLLSPQKSEEPAKQKSNINIVNVENSPNDNVKFNGATESNTTQEQTRENGYNFKSALLRERLQELEKEISIFQKENANLLRLKKQHEEEVARYKKERKEFERTLSEERERIHEMLQEERRKLSRERHVFERYVKRQKNHPSRKEREEIKALKQQVATLQEELIKKDSRWSATQVRTHNRMQQLDKQIAQLKEENEKLKQEKEKVKKVRFTTSRAKVPSTMTSNTKALHVINEQLGKLKVSDVEDAIVIKNVVPKKRIPASILSGNHPSSKIQAGGFHKENEWGRRTEEQQPWHFNSVPDLDPDISTDDLGEVGNNNTGREEVGSSGDCQVFNKHDDKDMQLSEPDEENDDEEKLDDTFQDTEINDQLQKTVYDAFYSTLEEMNEGSSEIQHGLRNQGGLNVFDHYMNSIKGMMEEGRNGDEVKANPKPIKSLNGAGDAENRLGDDAKPSNIISPSSEQAMKQTNKDSFMETMKDDGTREKVYQDGRQEIWYPNGNVKKISADKLTTKVIYYNGDVKEKFLMDGTEKYYYAETRTWHTTYKDGLEVLEFPNGQVERRHHDGTNEICYANGCVQLHFPDGREEWAMADGTVVKTSVEGEKVLMLPNGQREVHTKEHKRREYPDGTVKFLYPNGLQETRYANGRIRLKDKDGKLVMDSCAG